MLETLHEVRGLRVARAFLGYVGVMPQPKYSQIVMNAQLMGTNTTISAPSTRNGSGVSVEALLAGGSRISTSPPMTFRVAINIHQKTHIVNIEVGPPGGWTSGLIRMYMCGFVVK